MSVLNDRQIERTEARRFRPVRRMPRRLPAVLTDPPVAPTAQPELALEHALGDLCGRLGQLPSRAALESDPDYRASHAEIARVLDGFAWSLRDREPPARAALRAVAWNIERGKSFDAILRLMSEHATFREADLLLLTEVDLGMARSGNRNVGAELAAVSDLDWVFANHHLVLCSGDHGEKHVAGVNAQAMHGSALLTRLPVRRVASLALPEYRDKFLAFEKRLGCKRALFVEVELADGPLTVVVVHLDPFCSPAYRAAQMRAVVEGVAAFGGERVLLGGDLNTNTYDLSRGRSALRDAVMKLVMHGIRGSLAHYMAPQRRFEKAVFDVLSDAELEWESFNDLDAGTLTYDLHDPELMEKTQAYLPRPIWRLFDRVLGSTRFANLRLDWFAGRGLDPLRAEVIALNPPGQLRDRISDHHPICVEVAPGGLRDPARLAG